MSTPQENQNLTVAQMQQRTRITVKLLLATLLLAVTVSLVGTIDVSAIPFYPLTGNSTFLDKPGFPVEIQENQIQPGEVWTYFVPLKEGRTYHIYLIGEWVDLNDHITDYDIFLYKVKSSTYTHLSSHTEAAGYPEQVSNDGQGQFYIPSSSGNYILCVRNDPKDSSSSQAATLMVIEHIVPNKFYSIRMEEPEVNKTVPESSWAYEFNTSKPRIKVDIQVPDSLDMYEARFYPMANPDEEVGDLLDGVLTPWDTGLYGNLTGDYGGFNDDPQGYRHVDASDSCERSGEDMVIDYSTEENSTILYHLLYMAEIGKGSLRFRIQTDFTAPNITAINPPKYVITETDFDLSCEVLDESYINTVWLHYSVDGNETWRTLTAEQDGDIYHVSVPGQKGGITINYYWEAFDSLGNYGYSYHSAKAMTPTHLILNVEPSSIYGGEEVTSSGFLGLPDMVLTLNYTLGDKVVQYNVTSDDKGSFDHVFSPNQVGNWNVTCEFTGDNTNWPSASESVMFEMSRKPTSINLNTSRRQIGLGDYVNVTGYFSEEQIGYEVFITARNGLNTTTLFALTDENGYYHTTFDPDKMGEWSLRAEVAVDGIYTDAAISPPLYMDVSDPTLAYRVVDFQSNMFKVPYVYAVGTIVGGTLGGGLVLANKRGLLKNPFKKTEVVEEPVDVDLEEDDDDDFDF
jgi:hypothetical protein